MNSSRRQFLKDAALSATGLCLADSILPRLARADAPPNIILILTDDQGWNHVSYRSDPAISESASDYIETPQMARAARLGMRFTDAYAPNPICSPTRHSMLFGSNAARHVYARTMEWMAEAPGWLTIPKAIRQADPRYRAAHFGKWHVGITPEEAGFDFSDGITNNSQGEMQDGRFRNARGLSEQVAAHNEAHEIRVPAPAYSKQPFSYEDEDPKAAFSMTNRAEAFMRESVTDQHPFFAYIAHYATHLDLVSRRETYGYFQSKARGSRHDNPAFAAMCKDMDTSIGRVLNLVEELGIADNTYIFITSDNGGVQRFSQSIHLSRSDELTASHLSPIEWRNLPLRHGKHEFYEGGIRVPFLALGPGIAADTVNRSPVTGLDFLPTFAELAGGSQVGPDGASLAPALTGAATGVRRNRRALIFHQAANRTPISAIRKGRYKLIKHWMAEQDCKYCGDNLLELYDLSEDLGETNDLSARMPELTDALHGELLAFLEQAGAETQLRPRDHAYNVMLKNAGIDGNSITVEPEYRSPFRP
ncbi:MAG: sulfatase-like hydrolase/transferase [Candidatus Latescibacterota bacterium]